MYAPTTYPAKTYREMDAKYASTCGKCPYGILPGDRIATSNASAWRHVDCAVTVSLRTGTPAQLPKAPSLPDTGLDITSLDGAYAVETESGVAFLRVDAPDKGKWEGWRFAKRQAGPNFDRVGSQKPGGSYRGQWASLLAKVVADPETAMRRYGTELGHCGKCGLELTDEASRAYGVGPVCRKALGW
jgi:hypothetical protein